MGLMISSKRFHDVYHRLKNIKNRTHENGRKKIPKLLLLNHYNI